MARIVRMGRLPGTRMTGDTIGRGRVANRGADKNSCAGIMTARTRVMGIRGCAYKCIIMTVSTARCTNRDTRMAISGCRMNCAPGARMTGGTIGRGRMAYSRANKSSCARIMAAGTRVMRFRGCAYERIIMAVSTTGCTNRDACMTGIICMQ